VSRDELLMHVRSFVRASWQFCMRQTEDLWTKGSAPADAVRECTKDVRQNSNTTMAVAKTLEVEEVIIA